MDVTATEATSSSLSPQYKHNFWLGPLTSQEFLFECQDGDILDGSFIVTIDGDHFIGDQKKYDLWPGWGDGVDLYIFDKQNYESWSQGLNAISILNKTDLTALSWSVGIPSSGSWYVVYGNDSSVYGKQVEGNISHLSQNSIIILGLLVLGVCAFAFIIGIHHYKRR
ncbi:MAG: hypothetical protein ACXADC_09205 [Candidatus Thorarchaeota archaeon]|jgi:hypothetical protein